MQDLKPNKFCRGLYRFVRFCFKYIYKHIIMINFTETDVRKIETLAKDIFLSIVKTQKFEDLEGNLNQVARFAINTATTFLTNDWNQMTKQVLNIK